MSYFKNAQNRESMELVPGVRTRTFWGENMLLSMVEIDANSEVPAHTHPHEQAGVLVEGEMEMGIGGEVKVLKPGDLYVIPGNVEHYARCVKSSSTRRYRPHPHASQLDSGSTGVLRFLSGQRGICPRQVPAPQPSGSAGRGDGQGI